MSHFSQIKTQIRNLDTLKAALTDSNIAWQGGPVDIRGYQGQTQSADVAIAQDNGYDVGFCWNNGEYELVADLQYWQQPLSVQGFLNQITQRYAYRTIVNESAQKGFQVAEETSAKDGSVRLVLQRWNG